MVLQSPEGNLSCTSVPRPEAGTNGNTGTWLGAASRRRGLRRGSHCSGSACPQRPLRAPRAADAAPPCTPIDSYNGLLKVGNKSTLPGNEYYIVSDLIRSFPFRSVHDLRAARRARRARRAPYDGRVGQPPYRCAARPGHCLPRRRYTPAAGYGRRPDSYPQARLG